VRLFKPGYSIWSWIIALNEYGLSSPSKQSLSTSTALQPLFLSGSHKGNNLLSN